MMTGMIIQIIIGRFNDIMHVKTSDESRCHDYK